MVGLVLSPLVVLGAATRHGQVGRSTVAGVVLGCVVGGAAAARMGDPILVALYGLAIATAIAASAVDATEKRLPNGLTYPLAGGGLVVLGALSVLQGEGSLWRALVGWGIHGGWLFVASLTGLGSGDVKLAAGVGFWLGWLSWSALLAGVPRDRHAVGRCDA